MTETRELGLGGGRKVFVEVSPSEGRSFDADVIKSSPRDSLGVPGIDFDQIEHAIKDLAERFDRTFAGLGDRIESVTVDFSIRFGVEAAFLIAKSNAEGSFKVQLKWILTQRT